MEVDAPVVLGKAPSSDLVLGSSGVSRRHARLTRRENGDVEVEDLESTNGSFIDSCPVVGVGVLRQVDQRLRLGAQAELALRLCGEAELLRLERAQHALERLSTLRPREREVAAAVGDGLTSATIAKKLFISPRTVTTHLDRIYAALDLDNRAGLVRLVTEARSLGDAF